MSSSIIPTFALPKFDGTRKSYKPWLHSVNPKIRGLIGFNDPQRQGAMAIWTPPAQYLLLPRAAGIVAAAFVPHPHPGNRPIHVPGIAAVIANHNAACAQWTYNLNIHNDQQTIGAWVKNAVIDAVPDRCIVNLKHVEHGYLYVDLLAIRARLDAVFLILSSADLRINYNRLTISYNPFESLDEYIATHRDAHAIQIENNNPVPASMMFGHLSDGMAACGVFAAILSHHEIIHPEVADRNFDDLAIALEAFDKNRSSSTTAKAAGYAASAIGPPASAPASASSAPTVQEQLDAIQLAMAAMQPQPSNPRKKKVKTAGTASGGGGGGGGNGGGGGGGGGGSGGGGSGGGGGGRPPIGYCWTHGACHHTSHECKGKKINHDNNATFSNQLGGLLA